MGLDRQAIDQLLRAQEPRLRAILLARVRGLAGADLDDLLQEVRLRLWKALESEKSIEHLASYLHKTVLSVVIDAQRRRASRPEEAMPELAEEWIADERASADASLRSAERQAAVRAALARLPQRRREPAQLLLMGHSAPEIARMLGLTEATARNLAYRGVEELRELLQSSEAP